LWWWVEEGVSLRELVVMWRVRSACGGDYTVVRDRR
jgi:hypothetical protein